MLVYPKLGWVSPNDKQADRQVDIFGRTNEQIDGGVDGF